MHVHAYYTTWQPIFQFFSFSFSACPWRKLDYIGLSALHNSISFLPGRAFFAPSVVLLASHMTRKL